VHSAQGCTCYHVLLAPRAMQHMGQIFHYVLQEPIKGQHGAGLRAAHALSERSARQEDSSTPGNVRPEWFAVGAD
jgi:hypothetical protein